MKHIFKALALIVLAACSEKSNDPYENMIPTYEVPVESEISIHDIYFSILLNDLIQVADSDILSKFRAYIQEDLSSIGDLDLPVLLKMELAK